MKTSLSKGAEWGVRFLLVNRYSSEFSIAKVRARYYHALTNDSVLYLIKKGYISKQNLFVAGMRMNWYKNIH